MKHIFPLTSSCAVHQIDLIAKHGHNQLLVDVKQVHLERKKWKTNQVIRVTSEGWRA